MDRFLHTSVRLNTALGRATRFFSPPDKKIRWLCSEVEISPDKTEYCLSGVDDSEARWKWALK